MTNGDRIEKRAVPMDLEMENYYIASVMLTESIGCMRAKQLLDHFGSGEATWKAGIEELEATNLYPSILNSLINFRQSHPNCPEQLAEFCYNKKIKICSIKDFNYPERLKSIKDAPVLLYYKGVLESNNEKIAIVGTRQPTHYGLQIAEEWAEEIASTGVDIVSGAAYGIDMAAHKGAIKAGRTIAILGEGLEAVWPNDKKKFLEQIIENGAVVSEYSPNAHSSKGTFPQRNRIISGMSVGIVVVESDVDGGAMNTASHAAKQGRLTFVVPGSINWRKSRGCHELVRDGAILARSVNDVLKDCELNMETSLQKKKVIGLPPLEGNEEAVLKLIPMDTSITSEDIAMKLDDIEFSEISMILINLETKGYINEESFGSYVRTYGH